MDTTHENWFWLSLFALGAYHGVNPAMGWLFAVALGMQEKNGRAIYRSLLPLAIGHLLSVCVIVGLVRIFLIAIPMPALRIAGAISLIVFGCFKLLSTRHPRWVGMQVGARDLMVWSFLMASAHGAGLMLVPFLLSAPAAVHGDMHSHHMTMMAAIQPAIVVSSSQGWLVVAVHTLGYLLATLAIALLIFYKLGVAVLRRGWLNLDLLWAGALVAMGVLTLVI